MKRFWINAGVTLNCTDDEIDALLYDTDNETLRAIIDEGRFEFDGDVVIPESAVSDFNDTYGTDYDVQDYYGLYI